MKYRGEEVFWLKRTPTSMYSISFWSSGSYIVTKRGDINTIKKGIT